MESIREIEKTGCVFVGNVITGMIYKICQKCCMDTSDPYIRFDEQGICNHCASYGPKEYKRRAEVLHPGKTWTFYELKKAGEGKQYDCLLGLSGGVDSSLCLHYLVENGIRPLTYSVDNGWNTKESDENIMRLVETLKVPFQRIVLDIPKFRELQEAFIRSGTANLEIPTDHILTATSYELAVKYGIKHIISGGNISTEGIMPAGWGYQPRDLTFIKGVYRKIMGKKLTGLPTFSLKQYLWHRFIRKTKIVYLLDFYEYNREKAKQLLNKTYGWIDYGEKHCENRFTKWFQECYLPIIFGFDKRRAHYSSLINSGQITREQALIKIREPLTACGLSKEILSKLNIPRLEVFPKKTYKDYPNAEWQWNLLSKVYGNLKRFLHQR